MTFSQDAAPGWLADAHLYVARLGAYRVVVELSTVEIESDRDTLECSGSPSPEQ